MSISEERGRLAEGVTLAHEKEIELALILKSKRYSNREIAHIMRISESAVRTLIEENMVDESRNETEINWGYNCLTQGVHHGRQEAIWNLPLNYAIGLFSKQQLALLVLTRIFRDALQMTLSNEQFTTEWATRVRAHAEKKYDITLQHKVGEISLYYKSAGFKADLDRVVELVEEDHLNVFYEPLHPHDSINMLCRILGVSSSIKASEEAE